MQRAAAIGENPKHVYQAGVLRLQLQQVDAAMRMMLPLEKWPGPEAIWPASGANAWILKQRYGNAAASMERAARISAKPDHWHRAS